MQTICFEGPSAIGKTTLAKQLGPRFFRVAEVNELFGPAEDQDPFDYYRKQTQRLAVPLPAQAIHRILDGDPFQPLWYNWSYGFPAHFLGLEDMHRFYLKTIRKGTLHFPDHYFVFSATESQLRQRKANDSTRSRRNFEKHLRLTTTLPAYFGFLADRFPGLVSFLIYKDTESAKKEVIRILDKRPYIQWDHELILTEAVNWLSTHFSPTYP